MADLLSIGKTGLSVSKKAIETTGHNISNANTDGYSRQRVNQTTNLPQLKNGHIQGTGSRISSITRIHDEHLERRLSSETSRHNFHKERSLRLGEVEQIFNEVDTEGLTQILNKLFNSFRELAGQPENETVRSYVRDNAGMVVQDLRRIREALDYKSENIDKKLVTIVSDANQNFHRITKLNKEIAVLENNGQETGDLRDQRDLALRNLSEWFDLTTYTDNRGHFNVSIKNVGTVVSGTIVNELVYGHSGKAASLNKQGNSVDLYLKGLPSRPLTAKFQGGAVAGLLKTRNEDIRKLQEDMDTIAFELVNRVNAIHVQGFVSREIPTDQAGNYQLSDSQGPTSGIYFFRPIKDKEGAAGKITLSEEVLSNLSNIATGLEPNRPGDNRIAIAISKLQHEKFLDEGKATFEEKYLKTIADVGLKAGKAQLDKEQTEGILTQVKTLKERVSGVSIDEEAANLVKYQHAFDASARILRTADEMFDTVIGILKR